MRRIAGTPYAVVVCIGDALILFRSSVLKGAPKKVR
jgi:hypothetical protein